MFGFTNQDALVNRHSAQNIKKNVHMVGPVKSHTPKPKHPVHRNISKHQISQKTIQPPVQQPIQRIVQPPIQRIVQRPIQRTVQVSIQQSSTTRNVKPNNPPNTNTQSYNENINVPFILNVQNKTSEYLINKEKYKEEYKEEHKLEYKLEHKNTEAQRLVVLPPNNKSSSNIYFGDNVHSYTSQIQTNVMNYIPKLESKFGNKLSLGELNTILEELELKYGPKPVYNNMLSHFRNDAIIDPEIPQLNVAVLLKAVWYYVCLANEKSLFNHFNETLDQIGTTCIAGISHRLFLDYIVLTD
jgi:hypothetical protein